GRGRLRDPRRRRPPRPHPARAPAPVRRARGAARGHRRPPPLPVLPLPVHRRRRSRLAQPHAGDRNDDGDPRRLDARAAAPPAVGRELWRRPEQDRLQDAIGSLMQLATNEQEVAERVLVPSAAIVGARAVALRTADGTVVGTHNVPEDAIRDGEDTGPDVLELAIPGGSLL